MGTIGRSVIVVAALGWAAAEVRAEEGPTVRVGGLAPFSEAELEEALRVRLGGAHRVEVISGARVVTISVDGKTRSIRLGAERGMEAARVVALVAAAIALDGDEDGSVRGGGAAVTPAVLVPALPAAAAVASGDIVLEAPVVAPARRWSLAVQVMPAASRWTRPGTGALLAFDRASGDGVRLTAAIGLTSATREVPQPGPVIRLTEVPLRVGAWLGDRYAIGATAVAIPYSTSGGVGDRSVLFGAGVMARAQMTFTSGFGVVALAGVDGMASVVQYRWEGETVFASGRFRPWVAFGITWEGER